MENTKACTKCGIEKPLALGGSNDKANLQLLCPTCNAKKSAKHPIDFMQSRGLLL